MGWFIKLLVDVILGPFIHRDAVNMRNTPEYKASIAKIKEIDSLQKKLAIKAKKLQDEYDKVLKKELSIKAKTTNYEKFKIENDGDVPKIGSKYGGGIVFYLDKTGQHGLVCSENDLGIAIWSSYDGLIGAYGNGIGDGSGMANTKKIAEELSWYGGKGTSIDTKTPAPTAARLCLESNYNGYNDWYLPTKDELNLLYNNKNIIGGFANYDYWSSTEISYGKAWMQNTYTGLKYSYSTGFRYGVRAVRAF